MDLNRLPMGRNLSPALRQELANLEKDADSRKSAMKALKSYVKNLDSKAIPLFLAQVSETKDTASSHGEYTISLYEVLARVHGPNIVSQIDNIMSTIIKTLTTSGGSFPLQQACSKVVPAIARYGINPTTPEEKKRCLIHSLCKPLSDSLLCTQESLSCGAALCLKSLVDCDNWKFASDEIVNEVCLKLAGALEDKPTQTNSHMGLVMSLAKRNSLIVEAYARLLIHAGLRILNCGSNETNSQKRLTAIQMVHSMVKWLDIRSIFSELEFIIEEMEKCQSEPDQMPYVKGAAFEALQTAKRLLADKRSKVDFDVVSVTGSNFGRSSNGRRRYLTNSGDRSPLSGSPESQTLDSFAEYESFMDSPFSITQASCNVNHMGKNVNRKIWNQENGCVDISLKDGLFSELVLESSRSHVSSEQGEGYDTRRGYANGFPGFVPRSPANEALRSRTPSPERTLSRINVDNIKIFSTPRNLVRSLQDDDDNSDYTENQARRHRTQTSTKYEWSPMVKYDQNGHLHNARHRNGTSEVFHSDSESVSPTEDVAAKPDSVVSHEVFRGGESELRNQKLVRSSSRRINNVFSRILLVVFGVFAVFASVYWFGDQDEGHSMVPT